MKLVSLMLLSLSAYGASLMGGGATSNGVWVTYETRLEPGAPPVRGLGSGGVLTDHNVIKRYLCNDDNHTYFGYDLVVEPLASGRYRFRFAPLTIKTSELSNKVSDWKLLPLPGGPVTLEVRAGETVALDLFANPSTGQKVTDYLGVKGSERQQVNVAGPAHDYGPEDATIEISAPQVSVDGTATNSFPGGTSGQAVWIDLPRYGRFVFSLAPRRDLGMRKAGEIRGTTLTWRTGGHVYTITTDKPIVSGPRAYNLYVFHIPRATPHFAMSGGPRPDVPIRQK
jgi:hypothetical protein